MHLLLGTLGLRRGAVVECDAEDGLDCTSLSGALSQRHSPTLKSPLLKHDLIDADLASLVIKDGCAGDGFLGRYSSAFSTTGIKLVIPMAVRGELTGFVFLGSKASGEEFTDEDFKPSKRWPGTSGLAFTRIDCSNKWPTVRKVGDYTKSCAPSIVIP